MSARASTIESGIRSSLKKLCAQLADGQPADHERKRFEADLARAVARAIDDAISLAVD